jgi:hypothetical protein
MRYNPRAIYLIFTLSLSLSALRCERPRSGSDTKPTVAAPASESATASAGSKDAREPESAQEAEPEIPKALSGGAESVEELARTILEALEKRDLQKLHDIRVSQAEYQHLLWPRFPQASDPRNTVPWEFHWYLLDKKSTKGARAAIADYGGRKFELLGVKNSDPVDDYGAYRLSKRIQLRVRDSRGEEEVIAFLGSIVVMNGCYKMLSYRD